MTRTKQKISYRKRTAPVRPATPVHWPIDSHDEELRDALARELIGECLEGLRAFGVDGAKLKRLAAQAAAGTPVHTSRATQVLNEADQLAKAIDKWGEEPAYRDATGRPAVLSVHDSGRHSLAQLAREYFPGWGLAEFVTLGCKTNVFERIGADKVALLNTCVLFTGSSPLMLANTIRTVRRVFRAADQNRRVTANPEGWPDRAVWVEVTDEDFGDFVRYIRPQISAFIESSNRWLTRRAASPRNRRRTKRLAGIQIFVFRE